MLLNHLLQDHLFLAHVVPIGAAVGLSVNLSYPHSLWDITSYKFTFCRRLKSERFFEISASTYGPRPAGPGPYDPDH